MFFAAIFPFSLFNTYNVCALFTLGEERQKKAVIKRNRPLHYSAGLCGAPFELQMQPTLLAPRNVGLHAYPTAPPVDEVSETKMCSMMKRSDSFTSTCRLMTSII